MADPEPYANHAWDLSAVSPALGSWEKVTVAILLDIRRELETLNRRFAVEAIEESESADSENDRPRRKAKKG